MRDGVATSLFDLATTSELVRTILGDLTRNSLSLRKIPAPDLFEWSANAAEFFCRGVEQNTGESGRSIHWVLLYSNRFTSHVLNVAHLTSSHEDPAVTSIEHIVVINFSDIFKAISRIYAAKRWPDEGIPDALSSLILIDIISRLDFRRDDRLFNGVLLSLAPHLRFTSLNETRHELEKEDSDYIKVYGRIVASFIIAHEFAHLIWNIHSAATVEFKDMVTRIIAATVQSGHNFECFLDERRKGFDVEKELEPALRQLLTVNSSNVESFVGKLDLEELFCDYQASGSLVRLILDRGIFDDDAPDETVQYLAKLRICFEFVSLYNSSVSHILSVLESVGAMIRAHDRHEMTGEETRSAIQRTQDRSKALAVRSIIRSFLGERFVDSEIVSQVAAMTSDARFAETDRRMKDDTGQSAADMVESLYVTLVTESLNKGGACWRIGSALQKIKSDLGDLDKISSVSAIGSAQTIASEFYQENPEENFFDFFSYFVVGTAAFR